MKTRAKYAAGGIASVAASVGLVVAVAMSNSATLADVRGTAVGSGTVVVKVAQSDAVAAAAESPASAVAAESPTPAAEIPTTEPNGASVAVSAASSEPASQGHADQAKQTSNPTSADKSRSAGVSLAEKKIEIVEQVVERIQESRSDATRERESSKASNDRTSNKSEKDRRDDNKTQSHVSPDRRD